MSLFLNTEDINLDKSEIIRYLGMTNSSLTLSIDNLIVKSINIFKTNLRPRYVFKTFSKTETAEGILLDGSNLILTGENIKSHLNGAEKVVVLACTLGVEAERFIKEASITDLSYTIILDAIATEFIEKVCDKIEMIIMEEYPRYFKNFRFGVGYGDLPLDIQPEILKILDAERQIALYCNENNIMIPSKSVTGIFGLFKEEVKFKKSSPCDICKLRDTCNKKEGEQRCGYKN